MWKFLANPLQEMVKANLIQHKILNTSYYIDFFAVNLKVIIIHISNELTKETVIILNNLVKCFNEIYGETRLFLANQDTPRFWQLGNKSKVRINCESN